MGKFVLKNWRPREILSFLKQKGFVEIKRKKRSKGDHICLFNTQTKAYTEVDGGRKSFSAREMLTIAKQSKIDREQWLK